MALRLSQALLNALNVSGDFKREMSNCVLKLYTGAQPATADAAPTGTLLCTYSVASGALTREVRATGSVTITGTSGTYSTVKIAIGGGTAFDIMGGAVAFDTSLTVTAAAMCLNINNNPFNRYFDATNAAGVITLTARPGVGALANGWVPSGTVSGGDAAIGSAVNIGSGVAGVTAVNGLNWGVSAAGVLSKTSATWSGTAVATGTAGWFRIEAAPTDSLALDSSAAYKRMDGAVATSGAELNLSSTSITVSAPQTIDSFTVTLPTA